MRTRLVFLAIFAISISKLSAQTDIVSAYNAISPAAFPYYGIKTDSRVEPRQNYSFPFELLGNYFNSGLWCDLGLTIPSKDGAADADIYRKFTPSNGNYNLGVVRFEAGDNGKTMLITTTSTGAYVDALEVGVAGGCWDSANYYVIHVKQWKIETGMKVTVYRLKPTSQTPILFGSNPTIPTGINAQRIDETYQIDSTGKFVKTGEIRYQTKNYPLTVFYEDSINIWNGNEVKMSN